MGGWKQLVSRAGGRLRAVENECPKEGKAENKRKPAPFPIFLFGLIFQNIYISKSYVLNYVLFVCFVYSIL